MSHGMCGEWYCRRRSWTNSFLLVSKNLTWSPVCSLAMWEMTWVQFQPPFHLLPAHHWGSAPLPRVVLHPVFPILNSLRYLNSVSFPLLSLKLLPRPHRKVLEVLQTHTCRFCCLTPQLRLIHQSPLSSFLLIEKMTDSVLAPTLTPHWTKPCPEQKWPFYVNYLSSLSTISENGKHFCCFESYFSLSLSRFLSVLLNSSILVIFT